MKVKNSQEAVEAMKKTAPGAIPAADVAESAPNAGARQLPGKAIPANGAGNYRFSTTTAVKTAEIVAGAHEKACDLQVGLNKSKLPKAAPPEGSTLKDYEKQEYADNLFGTP